MNREKKRGERGFPECLLCFVPHKGAPTPNEGGDELPWGLRPNFRGLHGHRPEERGGKEGMGRPTGPAKFNRDDKQAFIYGLC